MTSGGLSTAFNVVFSLVVVILVVIVAAKLARRAGVKGPGAGLRVLDRAGLSREASVAVVEIDGRRLVVGVTPHGVNLLSELGTAVPAQAATATPEALPSLPFGLPGDLSTAADGSPAGDDGIQDTPAPPEFAQADPLVTTPTSALVPQPRPKARLAQGSVLAPSTWKQGVEALRDLTARKG